MSITLSASGSGLTLAIEDVNFALRLQYLHGDMSAIPYGLVGQPTVVTSLSIDASSSHLDVQYSTCIRLHEDPRIHAVVHEL